MSSTEQVALAWWQKPQMQSLLQTACGSSGLIGAGVIKVCHHFGLPVPDVSTTEMFASAAVTFGIKGLFDWWHNHPNNLARRLIKQLNGDGVSAESKAAIATALPDKTKIAAAAAVPGVADIVIASNAGDGAAAAAADPKLTNVNKVGT